MTTIIQMIQMMIKVLIKNMDEMSHYAQMLVQLPIKFFETGPQHWPAMNKMTHMMIQLVIQFIGNWIIKWTSDDQDYQ